MKVLNEKDIIFLKALEEDFLKRGEKSFLETMFDARIIPFGEAKKEALSLFEMKKNKIFINNSECFLKNRVGNIVGKNGDFFFITCNFKELQALGRNIQDIPYYLHFNKFTFILENGGDLHDLRSKSYFVNIEDYINFCNDLGLEYCAHLKRDFYNDIVILDKEEVIFDDYFEELTKDINVIVMK